MWALEQALSPTSSSLAQEVQLVQEVQTTFDGDCIWLFFLE
jgi:hypothetical protein